jgi:hypothetical protein
MARRKKPTVGDIYEVPLQGNKKGYVQYIGSDTSQLNSDVIRVFKCRESADSSLSIEEILKGEIEFYSHVTGMELGERDGSWIKVGNSNNVGDLKSPFFRDSADELVRKENGNYGLPDVSKTWYVWRMNEPRVLVKDLSGDNINADVGSALPPAWVVQRMNTGKYQFFYSNYK